MSDSTLTVRVPDVVQSYFSGLAAQRQPAIEDVLAAALVEFASCATGHCRDVAGLLAALRDLDDQMLWQAARAALSTADVLRLSELAHRHAAFGLTDDESCEADTIVRAHERTVAVRAEASVLLALRGHDVASLFTPA